VAYRPDWESLADALHRLMVTASVSEHEAKADLCLAISDGNIRLRVRIIAEDPNCLLHGMIVSGDNVAIPWEISPDDFDWKQSRPLQPWSRGTTVGNYRAFWGKKYPNFDCIELFRADVTKVLCVARTDDSLSTDLPPKKGGKMRSVRMRAEKVLKQLYPDGVPDQDTVSNKNLCKQVIAKLPTDSKVSDPTILRAAGRRK